MKLYLDEDLSPIIGQLLRRYGIDVTTAQEVGNIQFDDRAQLAYATGEERAIVTANALDFLELHREAVASNAEHYGIVLVPSNFRGDEFKAIAGAIRDAVKPYARSLRGLVLYVKRSR